MRRILYMSMIIFFSVFSIFGQGYIKESMPQRIILNLTEYPATRIAVTWRTIDKVDNPLIEYARSTGWREFEDSLTAVAASVQEFVTDKSEKVFYYSGMMKGLIVNSTYIYRVGGDSVWSEWNQFKTGKGGTEPFKFVYFGDPQNENKNHVSRVFREAFRIASTADFWLFSGDLLSQPEDKLMDEFFFAGDFMFRSIPIVMTPGNHDRAFRMENGKIALNSKGKKNFVDEVSELWKASFTLPENGLPGFEETSFYYDYHGARFILINTNDDEKLCEQAVWLEKLLEDNPNKWTIVSFHHPVFSAARNRDDDETRNAFMSLFDKYGVDLVLTGHDHAYARSYKLKNGIPVKDGEEGTVYVVSVSGPKMYSVNRRTDNLMAKYGGYVQLFQVISIDGGKLSYEAYTATGELYDSFELIKN